MSLHRLILLLLGCWTLSGETVRVSLLVTTDLHGNILPYDYFTARPAERGLAKIATLIRQERAQNPNTLLIDCGDTIQGSPLEGVYQNAVRVGKTPGLHGDPMMAAMNALQYDAMVVGNHEYNFGLKNFAAARKQAKFPWLSANTRVGSSVLEPFAPYLLKTVGGVKVAIIGITTPAVPGWEKPEHIKSIRFEMAVQAVEKSLAELRAKHKPDVVVAAHAGLDRDLKTGVVRPGQTEQENPVWDIAKAVKGIDAIVFGHTHSQLEQYMLGDVLLHQPRNWGISLGKVEFELEKQGAGWRIMSKTGKLLPVSAKVEADAEILRIAKPYHELTEKYLQTPVAESPAEMDAVLSRVQDSALIDAVQLVQMHYAKADVSMTALFNARARFPKGPITVRQIASMYIYDNELYTIEGNGKMLREALENAARYYNTCPTAACDSGTLINRDVIGFNYDMAQGVEYDVDLTQPAGQRIRNLKYKGKALDDAQPLRIAVNNYRAGGSAGYQMFRGAKIVWKSGEEIRDLIIEYFTQHKMLPGKADGNWKVVPEAARTRLQAEAREEAGRMGNQ